MKPRLILLLGIVLTIVASALWHGPVGNAGARTIADTEALARFNLDYFEMEEITPFVQRGPVTRRLWLSGEANDFQQEELARILDELPAVGDVQWVNAPTNRPGPRRIMGEPMLPLIVEVELLALGFFGLGFVLAYFFHRQRRNARHHII